MDDLKRAGLWNRDRFEELKFHDGSVQNMNSIPEQVRDKYRTAFEIDPLHCLQMTAARGKWIDQSQSHNVFMRGTSGHNPVEPGVLNDAEPLTNGQNSNLNGEACQLGEDCEACQ